MGSGNVCPGPGRNRHEERLDLAGAGGGRAVRHEVFRRLAEDDRQRSAGGICPAGRSLLESQSPGKSDFDKNITEEIMSASGVPQANPAALGLVGFGLTTVLLSLINAGLLPVGGEPVVLPLAIAFGGTAQIIAGIMEYRLANTFGATAFTAYGAFWWWFALLLLFNGNRIIDLSGAGPTVGAALLLWGLFTFGLWIAT